MKTLKELKKAFLPVVILLFFIVTVHAQKTATAVAVIENGAVVKINVTDKGSDYPDPGNKFSHWPKVSITGGGGSGAKASGYSYGNGGFILELMVDSGGSGYTEPPQITIEPPDKIIAEINAKLLADKKAELVDQTEQQTETNQTIAKYGIPICLLIGAILLFQYSSKKSKSLGKVANKDMGINKKTLFAAVVILVIGFAVYSHNFLHDKSTNSKKSASDSTFQSFSVSQSDVVGHWGNDADMVDIKLGAAGSCLFSAYGHNASSGTWHLSGNNILIDAGDGGSPISFVYQGGKLVGPNGHYLTPK